MLPKPTYNIVPPTPLCLGTSVRPTPSINSRRYSFEFSKPREIVGETPLVADLLSHPNPCLAIAVPSRKYFSVWCWRRLPGLAISRRLGQCEEVSSATRDRRLASMDLQLATDLPEICTGNDVFAETRKHVCTL